jgi:hypothetical protein
MYHVPDEWKEHFVLNRPAKIMAASGSYGEFAGENAVSEYQKTRNSWVSFCEERYPQRAAKSGFGYWCAQLFQNRQEDPLTRWEELAVEKLGYDCLHRPHVLEG